MINRIMDNVGCPQRFCLLCPLYVVGLLNILSNLNGQIPSLPLLVNKHILPYLNFHFWQAVFVKVPGEVNNLHIGVDPPTNKEIF